jgi:hypothetical protein
MCAVHLAPACARRNEPVHVVTPVGTAHACAHACAGAHSHGSGHGKRVPSPVQRESLRPSAKLGGSGDVLGGSKPSWMSAPMKPGQFAGKGSAGGVRDEALCGLGA